MSLFAGVQHDLAEIIWVKRVQDVEEVVSGRRLTSWVFVREVRHEVAVLLELRVQGLHTDLLVMRNFNEFDVGLPHQLLLANEDVLQEVLVRVAVVVATERRREVTQLERLGEGERIGGERVSETEPIERAREYVPES